MRVLIAHNPKAGAANHTERDLLEALRRKGLLPVYCSTRDPGFAEALCRPTELVVAAGGDGTVRKVLTQLPDRTVPVTILPLGTANNIARSLAIAGTVEDLAARWVGGEIDRFHVGLARGGLDRRFVESVGIGAFARSIAVADATSSKDETAGPDRGRSILRQVLQDAEPIRFSFASDGQSTSAHCLMLEVANTPLVGPNLPISHLARPADDCLDIVWVEPSQRRAMLDWLDAPQSGPPPAMRERVRKLTLTWSEAHSHIDDDASKKPADGELILEVEQVPARILLPRPAAAPRKKGVLLGVGA